MTNIYIIISIAVLVVIAALLIYTGRSRKPKRLSKLAMLAFFLIILGIVFGNNRIIGYSFITIGVLLSVIDIIKNLKSKN